MSQKYAHAEKDSRCRDNLGHGVARWLDMPGSTA
jgi:hypothetical protein